jgi:hypothetical protein
MRDVNQDLYLLKILSVFRNPPPFPRVRAEPLKYILLSMD